MSKTKLRENRTSKGTRTKVGLIIRDLNARYPGRKYRNPAQMLAVWFEIKGRGRY